MVQHRSLCKSHQIRWVPYLMHVRQVLSDLLSNSGYRGQHQSIQSIKPFQHYGWVCPRRSCMFVLQASLS